MQSPAARDSILRIHSAGLPLESSCSLSGIAAGLHGYTGADLAALAREAAMEVGGGENLAVKHACVREHFGASMLLLIIYITYAQVFTFIP